MATKSSKAPASPKKSFSWTGYCASVGLLFSIGGILLAAFSGLGTRWGWWGFRDGLGYFRDSVFASGAGFLISAFSLAGGLLAKSAAGRTRAWAGLALGLIITGNFFIWLHQAKEAPRIHDITTDTDNPPVFEAVLALRQDALNPPTYGGPTIAEQQKKAYPDIQPLLLNVPPDKAWQACLDTAVKMGWAIDATKPSQGRIEATDTTFWFGFKDDIVVRVLPQGKGSRVDVRSESRVGLSDVGTNAKRIRRYLDQVRSALGA